MPVLPLVGSTMIDLPGVMRPSRSASSIIASAMRSLTLPPGFCCSHLAHTVAISGEARLRRRTSGVPPMSCRTFSVTSATIGYCTPRVIRSNEIHRLLAVAPLAEVTHRDLVEAGGNLARHVPPQRRVDLVGLVLDREKALDRPLQRAHEIGEPNLLGRSAQVVAATRSAPRIDQPRTLELLEDLLQVALRDVLPARDVLVLRGVAAAVVRNIEHSPHA